MFGFATKTQVMELEKIIEELQNKIKFLESEFKTLKGKYININSEISELNKKVEELKTLKEGVMKGSDEKSVKSAPKKRVRKPKKAE